MARYNTIKYNDIANGMGVCVSVYFQGCHFHCPGCFNQETWPFEGGHEFNDEVKNKIISKLNSHGVLRSLCILGGEPLCEENAAAVEELCRAARAAYPTIGIYVWTGYTFETLCERELREKSIHNIFESIDVLITNPFELDKRDITLELRGSSNQEIYKFVTEEEFLNGGKYYGFERTTYPYVIKEEKFLN